jgi:hypothetical protein
MATSASFKQQCPSCEAMVPIRDPGLIGKKIDCPKCKYRFVVEEPDVEEDDELDDAPASKSGKSAGKGVKRRGEADEGAEKKKSGGPSSTLVLGLGLAGVAIILLAVGGFFLLGGSDEKEKPKPSPSTTSTSNTTAPTETVKNPEPPSATLTDVTNLLPNDTEGVYSAQVERLMGSSLRAAAFESPGGFRLQGFMNLFGFNFMEDNGKPNVTRIIRAESYSGKWSFNLMRTSRKMKEEEFRDRLQLAKGPKSPIEGREYFVIGAESLLDSTRMGTAPLGLHLLDDQTLIVAELPKLEEFLTQKAKPKYLSTPSAEQKPDEQQGGGAPSYGPPPGNAGGAPGAGAGAVPPGPPPGSMMPPGMGGPGMPNYPGAPGAAQQGPTTVASNYYLTIKPNLKSIMDRFEEGKPAPIFAYAGQFNELLRSQLQKQGGAIPGLQMSQFQALNVFGICVHTFNNEKAKAILAVELNTDDDAKASEDSLRKQAPGLVLVLGTFLGIPVDVSGPTGGMPGSPGMPYYPNPGGGGGASPPRLPSGPPGAGGGASPPGLPNYPGAPGAPGGASGGSTAGPSSLVIERRGKAVFAMLDLSLTSPAYDKLKDGAQKVAVRMKGSLEMASGAHRVHDLAAALMAYVNDKNNNHEFPRGTVEGKPEAERAGLPFAPARRVSWVARLLPYLGYSDLREKINDDKPWSAPDNVKAAETLIPQLLASNSKEENWWVPYPGVPSEVAATHWVGIGGVGYDAADYSAADPNVAKKLGVFGYDRTTRVEDIKDGVESTIALIQVPATYKTPWAAGGGSTIRGVSESDCVRPFVSAEFNGKRGTFAIMCDGKVRFIPEDMSDDNFKALCTINGGEKIDNLDQIAPVVPGPTKKSELKTAPLPTPPAPAAKPPAPLPTTPEKPAAPEKAKGS